MLAVGNIRGMQGNHQPICTSGKVHAQQMPLESRKPVVSVMFGGKVINLCTECIQTLCQGIIMVLEPELFIALQAHIMNLHKATDLIDKIDPKARVN